MTEHEHQVMLMEWIRWNTRHHPCLRLMYAVPNGSFRHIGTAKRLKDEGVKAGVPDLALPVARGGYHGLYIEMKSEKGRLSSEQKQWIFDLNNEGYHAIVAVGWESAKNEIIDYLNLGCR